MTDDLPGAWKQVEKLLAERGGSEAHNTAFELMKDLWEIYEEQKKPEAFSEKIKALIAANRKRSSLIWRFRDEGLLPEKK